MVVSLYPKLKTMENVREFIELLEDKGVNRLMKRLDRTINLDKRMNTIDEIIIELGYLEEPDVLTYLPDGVTLPEGFTWDDFVDSLKELALE
jgi:hypothetical protein